MLESFVRPKRCAIASLDTLRLGIKEAARGGFSGGLCPTLLMLLLWRLGGFLCGSQGIDTYSGGLVAGDVYHGTHHVQNAVYASYEGDAFNGQATRLGVP